MILTPEFISKSKQKLLQEQARLKEELGRFAKPTENSNNYETTFDNIGSGEDENASEVEEYTDNLALEDNLEKQLQEINLALKKIEDGSYGICENCEKEIDLARLEAYPAAKTCIQCK